MRKRKVRQSTAPSSAAERTYSFSDVIKYTTATRSNLIRWTDLGIIKPDIADTEGPGHHRLFSFFNLVQAEMCAAVNRFRVPGTIIWSAADELRFFHELCVAVQHGRTTAESPALLSPDYCEAVRSAVEAVYVTAFVRRDARHGIKSSPKRYVDSTREQLGRRTWSDDAAQQALVDLATAWTKFCSDEEFRSNHFFGLFVFPEDKDTQIHHEPDLSDSVEDAAIVINLARVLFHTERQTQDRLRVVIPA